MEDNKINETKNIDLFESYNIKLKEPKYIRKYHTNLIFCSTVLKDGRFATGSKDKLIIIYNQETYIPDMTIKAHNGGIRCIIQISSGELVSCSEDNTIKIYKINENKYEIIQTLTYHTNWVNKIIELNNKQLVSCSFDHSIIFYTKDGPIIQTKDNEICYYEDNKTLCFYDITNKKISTKLNGINASFYNFDSLLMISKDLLLITGKNQITIINVNSYELAKIIDVSNSGLIFTACLLNNNMILTSDENKRIIQWKLKDNGNDLELISKKENAHDGDIYTLTKLGNGLILSAGYDQCVKIW